MAHLAHDCVLSVAAYATGSQESGDDDSRVCYSALPRLVSIDKGNTYFLWNEARSDWTMNYYERKTGKMEIQNDKI